MPTDFAKRIHDPAFDLGGRHLVAASAGTGKTYNIQNVYARLVMEKGLGPRQILVVTFTNAATKELRDRIRGILRELRDLFPVVEREKEEGLSPPGDESDARRQAREMLSVLPDDRAARDKALLAVQAAVLGFDQAEISTIDHFCIRALRAHAFESGFSFAAESPSSVRAAQLSAEARDWWRRTVVRKQAPDWPRVEDVADDPEFTLDFLVQKLSSIANRKDLGLALPEDCQTAGAKLLRVAHEIVAAHDDPVRRASRKDLDFSDVLLGMRDALRDGEAGEAFARTLRAEYKAVLIDEFQDTDPVQYEIFRRVFFPGPSVQPPVYFVGDPKQAIYAFRGGDIHTYRRAVNAPGMETDARNHFLPANHRSTAAVVKAVNGLFQDRDGDYTFGDSAIAYPGDLVAASGKPDFTGDPDGAAFRFVVPDAIENKEELWDLVADRVAELLLKKPEFAPKAPKKDRDPSFRPVKPSDVAVLVLKSKRLGRELAQRLRDRGVPAVFRGDESVFASPERDDLAALVVAMAEPGNAAAVRMALLTPFFRFPPAWIADLAAGRAAPVPTGRFPFLGDGTEASMPAFLHLFRELRARWETGGFLAAFDLLDERTRCRVCIASGAGGERRLVNCLHLAELLQAAATRVGPSPEAQRDWFLHGAADEAGDEAEIRLETEESAVQVLTVHKSKGLEFPVVVLPDVWEPWAAKNNVPGSDPDPALFFHRDPDAADGEKEPQGTLAATLVGLPGADQAAAEGEDERMRLVYVAMTRASHYGLVFAPGADMKRTKMSKSFEKILARAEAGVSGVEVEHVATAAEDTQPVRFSPARDEKPLEEALDFPRIPPPLGSGSFSSLSPEKKHVAPAAPGTPAPALGAAPGEDAGKEHDDDDDVPFAEGEESAGSGAGIFAFPAGKKTGSCWHELFERLPFDAEGDALREAVRDRLLAWRLLANLPEGDAEARLDAAVAMVRRTLDIPLPGAGGATFRLRDVPASDRLAEWEFNFSSRGSGPSTAAVAGVLRKHWGAEPEGSPHRRFLAAAEGWNRPLPQGFLTGSVDLFFRHGGDYFVIDWKSNALGGTPESFTAGALAEEMASRFYFFQYLLYSAAVHRFLGERLPDHGRGSRFGGVFYVFLRGVAAGRGVGDSVFADRPSPELLEDLARVLGL